MDLGSRLNNIGVFKGGLTPFTAGGPFCGSRKPWIHDETITLSKRLRDFSSSRLWTYFGPLLGPNSPLVLTIPVLVSSLPIMGGSHSMYKLVCHNHSTYIQALLGDPLAIKELELIEHDGTRLYLRLSLYYRFYQVSTFQGEVFYLLAHASPVGQPNVTSPVSSTII